MTAYEAHAILVFVWNYLRERRNVTQALRQGAVRSAAIEMGIQPKSAHRHLKIALGLDPIVGGCGYITDAEQMLRQLIEADSEEKMLQMLIVLRREHPKASPF